MATSITPLANISSMVTIPRSTTSQLKIQSPSPSVKFSNLFKCTKAPCSISLSPSIYFSGAFHFAPAILSSPSLPRYQRRTGFVSSIRADAQSTEDLEAETVIDEEVIKESSDDEVPVDDSNDDDTEEIPTSVIVTLLESYKEALLNNDKSKVDEVESFLQSLEEEKNSLANEVASLSQELLSVKDRVLRISADFDNYRKRTERDRLSLMTNVQGELVESFLPVLDNFERAKAQIKLETDGEEKINNSYQSIYKQFGEILSSLGVVPVETVGKPFDPLLHEAIMREDSSEFEEGIILQEFRKGFQLGERLLRPSMVKVSAGPGPEKPKEAEIAEDGNETQESS